MSGFHVRDPISCVDLDPKYGGCMRCTYIILLLLLSSCGATSHKLQWTGPVESEDYPLDEDARRLATGSGAYCPVVQVQEYDGSYISYAKPLQVNPFFRERLIAFEEVVQRVAIRTIGVAPTAILHFGTYNCRTIAGKPKLSEHAFANAIDVSGFEFQGENGPVRISVLKDWWRGTAYSTFMHELVIELAAHPEIFRGVLGPGYPGHDDHLHLDAGPRHYINVRVPD